MYLLKGKFPFLEKVPETRASVNFPADWLKNYFEFGDGFNVNTAGVRVTSDSALKHSAYWRAVNLLSSQIASFPINLHKRLPNGNTEEIKNHPAVYVLTRKPNNVMTSFIWRESTQANTLVHGNGYAFIERDNLGNPSALKLMDSVQMNPKSDGVNMVYEYIQKTYDPYYILHIPGVSFDGVKGKAVLEAGAESIGVGLAMQKYSANMFKHGAKQTGVLTHPLPLSPKATQGLRTSFDKNMKGEEGGTMVLDEGMKWQATGIPPDQAQLLQSKQFSIQDVARWFGIPVHLLMEESRSTFNNISEQGISFVRYTLTQWVNRWEAELNAKLLTEKEREDHFFKFNMDSLMRGSLKERMEAYRTGLDLGIYNIDECRRYEDLNELLNGEGKKHLVQINRTPIEELGNTKRDGE